MIDKLRPGQVLGSQNSAIAEMAKKINELINKINDDPNDDYYKCIECGCEWFEHVGGGANNGHTPALKHHYLKCKDCGKEQTINYYFSCKPHYRKYRPDKDHMGGYIPW